MKKIDICEWCEASELDDGNFIVKKAKCRICGKEFEYAELKERSYHSIQRS